MVACCPIRGWVLFFEAKGLWLGVFLKGRSFYRQSAFYELGVLAKKTSYGGEVFVKMVFGSLSSNFWHVFLPGCRAWPGNTGTSENEPILSRAKTLHTHTHTHTVPLEKFSPGYQLGAAAARAGGEKVVAC